MDDSTRNWKAVLDAERGEAAPDGWQWFGEDGWGKGLVHGYSGFHFQNTDEARALPVLRATPPCDRDPEEAWGWSALAWFSADRDPDPLGRGGWEEVAEGEAVYALGAIEAAEDAVAGENLAALVTKYVKSWEDEGGGECLFAPTECEWCAEAGDPGVAVARTTLKGKAICSGCAAQVPEGSLDPRLPEAPDARPDAP